MQIHDERTKSRKVGDVTRTTTTVEGSVTAAELTAIISQLVKGVDWSSSEVSLSGNGGEIVINANAAGGYTFQKETRAESRQVSPAVSTAPATDAG